MSNIQATFTTYISWWIRGNATQYFDNHLMSLGIKTFYGREEI